MKLGLTEFLLVLAIALVTIGPVVGPWLARWHRRAQRTAAEAARARAAYQAQMKAERDAILRRFRILGLLMALGMVAALVYTLTLRPISASPQRYDPPETVASGTLPLTGAQQLALEEYEEVLALRREGDWLYLAARTDRGSALVRMQPDGASLTVLWSDEAELTGFDFAPDGSIWYTAASSSGGQVGRIIYDNWGAAAEPVLTQLDGKPLPTPAALAAGEDGKIYFALVSDQAGSLEQTLRQELLAHTGAGAVYVYDPAGRTVQRVLGGVAGASALALEGETLYVADLGSRCVWSLPASARELTAGGKGCTRFAGSLPGYPAALALDDEGALWVGLRWQQSDWLEGQADQTFLRGVALRAPRWLQQQLFGGPELAAVLCTEGGQAAPVACPEGLDGVNALCPVGSRLYLGGPGGLWLQWY